MSFIPIAERTGQYRAHRPLGRESLPFASMYCWLPWQAVAKSLYQLIGRLTENGSVVEHILHEVQLAEVSPQCIEFEITETLTLPSMNANIGWWISCASEVSVLRLMILVPDTPH